MKKLIVGLVATALMGCATAPKKPAAPPRPAAALAVVCGEKSLQAIWIVFNAHVTARFTTDGVLLMTSKDGHEEDRDLPPVDMEPVIALAEQALVADILHVDCGIKTKE